MITKQLIDPKSIVVVGGSDNLSKPGGNALYNVIHTGFKGNLYVVNPKADTVQGVKAYQTVDDLPQVDLAILAIPAGMCTAAVDTLCRRKGCKAVIIFSAGFHEDGEEGARIEKEIVDIVNETGASLIGPNCIGAMTQNYAGIFTKPVPKLSKYGADFISGSGATVVFILEAAMQLGLQFSSIFSVGNSAQLGVEDILEYLDESYVPGESSPLKMLYIESINKPEKLLKHARSLKRKGAHIVAIKAGYSEAGSRAASSHTGALASPDQAVNALFKKAGIIRCYGRTELANMASVLTFPKPEGKKIAIVTHAGGPAVMLTDVLSTNGINIPLIKGEKADELLTKLYPGSSVANPIDFLATGTAEQLGHILDACENDFDVDAVVVIFGSPGLARVYDVYDVLYDRISRFKKPIYPVLPSVINVKEEIQYFMDKGGVCFPDEVIFGKALADFLNAKDYTKDEELTPVDMKTVRSIVDNAENGYLSPDKVQALLDAAGINRAREAVVDNEKDLMEAVKSIGYPIVMKVVGPVHKTDVGGVTLNITDDNTLLSEFNRMMKIKDTTAVLLQPMLSGTQLFIGAKREGNFGHLVMCGLGGIFIEAIKDVASGLAPISKAEADDMIKSLRGYKLIQGTRGQEGVNEPMFNEIIRRVSALCKAAPEIYEMDINPLLGNSKNITAVDARIRIEKK